MSKVSRILLSLGIALGILWGLAMVSAALDHNPQNEFTDNPEDLIPIFYGWMAFVSLPFSLIALFIEIIRFLKRKKT